MARVAINGLGRIGRAVFKILLDTPELEVVGTNDIIYADQQICSSRKILIGTLRIYPRNRWVTDEVKV
ncbi:glyceraldehyde 3-phosphate dehydrogenase NAD-binding domain-containing protein [Lyngbya sp. PCC 8106]|uniref:glyceraldehyde 3-phosphate dehydrogenase NAD-binding domain-containing protein n=1 Tax=Lyngbya sp. (strain PCC 8106) TaxID=313612 RepID=UPI0000EAC99F|nr:glyceraldehyde 3-phosphate dehydrogenase NAD-binding domain-containing protein [Lyngbya sp. PCC 8106]EAW37913.1 hypothetical protein L8106_05800 [Lyngbya sp. PCC 8106]